VGEGLPVTSSNVTPEFAKPPEEVDLATGERGIRMASLVVLVALGIAVPLGHFLLPAFVEFPTAVSERLAFAVQNSVFVLVWVLIGVGMVSTGRRFSAADSGGSAARPPSPKIAIRVAFLQNTLEQAVLASGLYLALATLLTGAWLSLIPVAVVFFGIGRVLFLRRYHEGAAGRAWGMTLTLMPTMLGYLLAIVLVVASWF
jgi:hypothetical protein